MITELAEIEIKAGREAEFETAVSEAVKLFLGSKGCSGLRLLRSLEQPSRYRLFVQWETVEDHMVEFRNSSAFLEWRGLIGPFIASPPRVEHLVAAVRAGEYQINPASGLEGSA